MVGLRFAVCCILLMVGCHHRDQNDMFHIPKHRWHEGERSNLSDHSVSALTSNERKTTTYVRCWFKNGDNDTTDVSSSYLWARNGGGNGGFINSMDIGILQY